MNKCYCHWFDRQGSKTTQSLFGKLNSQNENEMKWYLDKTHSFFSFVGHRAIFFRAVLFVKGENE